MIAETENAPRTQAEMYLQEIQKLQDRIDLVQSERLGEVAKIPRGQARQNDTPEQARARAAAANLEAQVGDLLIELKNLKSLARGHSGQSPEKPTVLVLRGYYGPVTVRFTYIGRPTHGDRSIPEEVCRRLDPVFVQQWYESRGWPRNGTMTTYDFRRRGCGVFRVES